MFAMLLKIFFKLTKPTTPTEPIKRLSEKGKI